MREWIVTSSALIGAVIALRALFRGKISRRLQYALWGLVLLRLLAPVSLISSPLSIMNAVPDGPPAAERAGAAPAGGREGGFAAGSEVQPSVNLTVSGEETAAVRPNSESMGAAEVLKRLWAIGGACVGLSFLGINLLFYRRLRKTRTPYPADGGPPVYVTEALASPCLFGLFRPAIYLTPAAAAGEDRARLALAHEQCHFRHGDHIWSLLRGFCLAVWWWNPLVWAAAVLSRADGELACDEAVLRRIGEENRLQYGRALVDMVAVRKAPSGLLSAATTMASGKRGMQKRLKMIIRNPKAYLPAVVAVVLLAAFCVGCTFTSAKSAATAGEDLTSVSYAERLYRCRNPYIGNASANGALLAALGVSEKIGPYSMELETGKEPYVLRLIFTDPVKDEAAMEQAMGNHAVLLLALIGNASEIQWRYSCSAPESAAAGEKTGSLTLAAAAKALGGADVKTLGETAAGVQTLLEQLEAKRAAQVSYALVTLGKGTVRYVRGPLTGDEAQLAAAAVTRYLLASTLLPGVEIRTLNPCYLVRAAYADGTRTEYYAYLKDGKAFLQAGGDGLCSPMDEALYQELAAAAQNGVSAKEAAGFDRTDLDACVSDAILRENRGAYLEGEVAVETHTVLKTAEGGGTVTVYAMALYLELDVTKDGLAQVGGSHMPVAVTFQRNAAGEYALKEYWTPQDGSYYGPSIREKFPSELYSKAMDTQAYIQAQMQACYAKAVSNAQLDTGPVIEKLLAAILASPAQNSDPGAYLKAHPIEYRELKYYGDYTLRYVYAAFLKGGETGLKGQIMLAALRDLLGEEAGELPAAKTAQDWFDAWKAQAVRLGGKHPAESMLAHYPKTWLFLQMLG